MLFFLLINVKMPTVVGILTFMSRKTFTQAELSMNIFYNLGGRVFIVRIYKAYRSRESEDRRDSVDVQVYHFFFFFVLSCFVLIAMQYGTACLVGSELLNFDKNGAFKHFTFTSRGSMLLLECKLHKAPMVYCRFFL